MKIQKFMILITGLVGFTSCTGQLPNSFRLAQQEERFTAQSEIQVNTQVDLLWVVDNSASMDVSQDKLRQGFRSFAERYLQATWDIRIAVITTDTYLAHPAFAPYLGQTLSGTKGWKSRYIASRNLTTGIFDQGIQWDDVMPAWNWSYARLLPGAHDGPGAGLCYEGNSYFFYGAPNCRIRDDINAARGLDHCLSPTAGETSATQCVNTLENDTIHSGKPILNTISDDPNTLNDSFLINVTTGTAGSGSERGFASVLQLLSDNEFSDTAFFRKGSLRGIFFVTDEDDQSLIVPSIPPTGFSPNSGYLEQCQKKTVDDYTYTLSSCADPTQLVSVSDVKTSLDRFFRRIDGSDTTPPNYFIVSITPNSGDSLRQLQALRAIDDRAAGNPGDVSVDRGGRYIALGELVGNGSLNREIAEVDYAGILHDIGETVVAQKSTFTLIREPTGSDEMIVTLVHADGTKTEIPSQKYAISGKTLTLTDPELTLSLRAGDVLSINYQPRSVL
ncbi:hypothetical protein WDW86_18295 [Bdellovibrionota bacterium FG-2]